SSVSFFLLSNELRREQERHHSCCHRKARATNGQIPLLFSHLPPHTLMKYHPYSCFNVCLLQNNLFQCTVQRHPLHKNIQVCAKQAHMGKAMSRPQFSGKIKANTRIFCSSYMLDMLLNVETLLARVWGKGFSPRRGQ